MIRNKITSYIDILRNANLGGVLREAANAGIEALERVRIPPNEPLTLEQLREMDGEPVWVDDKKTWALLQVWDDENIDVVFPMPKGCFHAKSVIGRKIYRRPPEG